MLPFVEAGFRMRFADTVAVLALLLHCGGKAVIDDPRPSGSGGAALNGACDTIAPVGEQSFCGETVGGTECSVAVCDEVGNRWETTCAGKQCECSFNNDTKCNCLIE